MRDMGRGDSLGAGPRAPESSLASFGALPEFTAIDPGPRARGPPLRCVGLGGGLGIGVDVGRGELVRLASVGL